MPTQRYLFDQMNEAQGAILRDEEPSYRLFEHGSATLSDSELVALVTGRPVEEARMFLRDGLPSFARRPWGAGRRHQIGRTVAVRIAASLELGRRVAMATIEFGDTVCVEDLGPFLATRYGDAVQEHFGAAFLNARRGMIALRELCVGTLNSALVSPREVLRSALELHAAGIIAYHNHPSGDPSPSVEDLTVTMKLRNAAKNMDIDFIDHVIVAKRRYYSMAKHGHF